MAVSDCIFCKMVAGDIPVTKIYEDEHVLAFMDIAPISDGHTLVIPRRHYEKIHHCPPELLSKVCSPLGKIAAAVQKAVKADAYNVLCNNGRAAGQVVEHLHFHIVPRNSDDGVFNRWPSYEYPEGKMQTLAEKIREQI
ncbi:MAG: HIT family protein [Phycisphaerae bacterium]|nr:HIT family protein [Phycisphaerae bacterium]